MHDFKPKITQVIPFIKQHTAYHKNILPIVYVLVSYASSLYCLVFGAWWLGLLSVLWLTHAMVLSVYLMHECAHYLIAKQKNCNHVIGEIMQWINGNAYFSHAVYQKTHLLHHKLKADVIDVDYRTYFAHHPLTRRCIALAEFCYVPLFYYMTRIRLYRSIATHGRLGEKIRLLMVAVIRVGLAFSASLINPYFLLLYGVAQGGFIHVIRMVDAFQHDFHEIRLDSTAAQERRKQPYELAHTFNAPLAGLIWDRLVLLNFVYHRAHHVIMTCPWYLLPQLHRKLFAVTDPSYDLSLRTVLAYYHRYRVVRLTSNAGIAMQQGQITMTTFYGAMSDRIVG